MYNFTFLALNKSCAWSSDTPKSTQAYTCSVSYFLEEIPGQQWKDFKETHPTSVI